MNLKKFSPLHAAMMKTAEHEMKQKKSKKKTKKAPAKATSAY
jgi:hypothetical protein